MFKFHLLEIFWDPLEIFYDPFVGRDPSVEKRCFKAMLIIWWALIVSKTKIFSPSFFWMSKTPFDFLATQQQQLKQEQLRQSQPQQLTSSENQGTEKMNQSLGR